VQVTDLQEKLVSVIYSLAHTHSFGFLLIVSWHWHSVSVQFSYARIDVVLNVSYTSGPRHSNYYYWRTVFCGCLSNARFRGSNYGASSVHLRLLLQPSAIARRNTLFT